MCNLDHLTGAGSRLSSIRGPHIGRYPCRTSCVMGWRHARHPASTAADGGGGRRRAADGGRRAAGGGGGRSHVLASGSISSASPDGTDGNTAIRRCICQAWSIYAVCAIRAGRQAALGVFKVCRRGGETGQPPTTDPICLSAWIHEFSGPMCRTVTVMKTNDLFSDDPAGQLVRRRAITCRLAGGV